MAFKDAFMGVLTAIMGIALTVVGWFWIDGINTLIELPLLKGIFWVGTIGIWVTSVVIAPYMMISGSNITIWNVGKGIFLWLAGTFGSMISYYVVPPILSVIDSMTGVDAGTQSSMISGIAWFILILFWITVIIILPLYSVYGTGGQEDDQ